MRLALLCAAAAVCLPAPRAVTAGGPDVASREVRVEQFVLEDADGKLAGFALWRRREGTRGIQLERELRFRSSDEPGVETGLFHVECLERTGSRLVQREVGSGGRAVMAEWAQVGGALRAFEWGPCGTKQEVLAVDESAALPLYLSELARTGQFAAGRIGCFDPQSRAVVELDVQTRYVTDAANPSATRRVELRRADGTLYLEMLFTGVELSGFRLQDGGPWGRRVTDEEARGLQLSEAGPSTAAR